jgi:hypothetical protein
VADPGGLGAEPKIGELLLAVPADWGTSGRRLLHVEWDANLALLGTFRSNIIFLIASTEWCYRSFVNLSFT